ncbi:MAG: AraC family transcriptional regulator [Sphingobacteriia bacterium 24-36-13]|jgi:AraC-like DNA-binding protein|uniref:helix-turn-helix domain-containing protein n=1 Tax=Sediminibacterium sp. TaxID=1917865 RepID=UPI000BD5473C|nr:helix-turn-helix transcriptional regulator [Sediminibacterium sp.]OYY08192.1 MAG: AraC family transcriptional regulator [Sphingobacteriia bacterium 35-36-14]OYZ53320.1 MAG: AraC family transcriptional regulator [Sphingobacteriia bacterium 24-36-13]OZA64182.1 MAG: AraC family transcriptional regulator [Sphingobacteriia bacterium 39-36-14]HQS23153.1 helix-turn-helix transcriptional regulator [Sediminibacterium sp.]HQS34078.1 helix-turn-helix transcriptional regulator [Sediminibacterium sp.]
MKPIIHLQSIADLYQLFNLGHHEHPLIAVIDFSKVSEQLEQDSKITTDFYSIMFKNYCKNHIKYGRKTIDFQEGNLICIAPRQVIEIDVEVEHKENMLGWGLFFHPDLIRATSLYDKISQMSFFSYEITEALHLSDKEKNILYETVQKIELELQENIDDYSQHILVSTIELLLNYCSRFYGRQLITRSQSNKSIVSQIESLLRNYFTVSDVKELPSVKSLADKVHLSSSYLSDLLKKETGKNAQEHIHFYLIEEAKNRLLNSPSSINEIAFSLGFEYPQYFTKLFKQKTGYTPIEYRQLN